MRSAERPVQVVLWVVAVLLALVALSAIASDVTAVTGSREGHNGVDFRLTVFGPSVNIDEGSNPWAEANAVPRFGDFPPSPYLPSLYVPFPLVTEAGLDASASAWILWSGVITLLAGVAIARSVGVPPPLAIIISSVVLLAPASRYNLELGQLGVGAMASIAYFSARHRDRRGILDHVEAAAYLVTAALVFVKPTFALTFLAAELAYRRSAWLFAKVAAGVAVVSAVMFGFLSARTDTPVTDLVDSIRTTSSDLGELPVNRMDGDRVDLLSLITPSVVIDVLALVVCVALLVAIARLASATLEERLVLGVGAVTLLTYHHLYDTLPFVLLLLCLVVTWPLVRAALLAAGIIAVGALRAPGALSDAWTSVITINWFVLQARLLFVLGAIVLGVVLVDALRRRDDDPATDLERRSVAPTGAPGLAGSG